MLNTSAESGASRRSSTGGQRKKSLKGQNKPKAYKLGETTPMNVSFFILKLPILPEFNLPFK
jgi:hypothetical protein